MNATCPLTVAAIGIRRAAAEATGQGLTGLGCGLELLAGRLSRESGDAREQTDDGLDRESALAEGLVAACREVAAIPPPPAQGDTLPGVLLTIASLIGAFLLGHILW